MAMASTRGAGLSRVMARTHVLAAPGSARRGVISEALVRLAGPPSRARLPTLWGAPRRCPSEAWLVWLAWRSAPRGPAALAPCEALLVQGRSLACSRWLAQRCPSTRATDAARFPPRRPQVADWVPTTGCLDDELVIEDGKGARVSPLHDVPTFARFRAIRHRFPTMFAGGRRPMIVNATTIGQRK